MIYSSAPVPQGHSSHSTLTGWQYAKQQDLTADILFTIGGILGGIMYRLIARCRVLYGLYH